jgi:hypothetical protein
MQGYLSRSEAMTISQAHLLKTQTSQKIYKLAKDPKGFGNL